MGGIGNGRKGGLNGGTLAGLGHRKQRSKTPNVQLPNFDSRLQTSYSITQFVEIEVNEGRGLIPEINTFV